MLREMKYWTLWLSVCHISFITGENLCKRELLIHMNVSAELESDVLLPCNFNTTLLGSDKTADIAVVWSQKNTTEHNLVEITLRGESRFWDYKGGRINTFPKLSESGNFSILLQNVQLYDLSLYRCELYNGTCNIAYQDLHLHQQQIKWTGAEKWLFIAGGVGVAVLTVLVVVIFFLKRARCGASDERVYANTRFRKRNEESSKEQHSSNQHAAKAKNKVHADKPQKPTNIYANSCMNTGEIYINQPH